MLKNFLKVSLAIGLAVVSSYSPNHESTNMPLSFCSSLLMDAR